MFGLGTLDLILGLTFTYLVLALVCTAANEMISQFLNLRARTLEQGLWILLTGEDHGRPPWWKFTALRSWFSPPKRPADKDTPPVKPEPQYTVYVDALKELRGAAAGVDQATQSLATARREVSISESQIIKDAQLQSATQTALRNAFGASGALQTLRKAADDLLDPLTQATTKLANARVEVSKARKALRDAMSTTAVATLDALDAEAGREAAQSRAGGIVDAMYSHPLIRGLSLPRWKKGRDVRIPSYIPPGTFRDALLDRLVPRDGTTPLGVEQLRASIGQLPEQLRKPLQIFLDEAAGDVQSFRASVGKWYEDSMERVSGLYKRKLQVITFTLGLLIALFANADTIAISSALAKDATLRSAVASYAQASAGTLYAQNEGTPGSNAGTSEPAPPAQPPASPELLGPRELEANPPSNGAPPLQSGASNAPPDSALLRMGEARQRIEDLVVTIDQLQSIGVPLGWKAGGFPWDMRAGEILSKLLGILLTALAISMGAPFWFDMLNKVVNIRGAGRAPEERPKSPEVLPPARGA